MKIISRDVFPFQENYFFAPIRSKVDYAKVIVMAARLLIVDIKVENVKNPAYFKLIVDKMSRLFFYKEDRYFSISFPFTVRTDNEIIEITTYTGKKLDNKIISAIISILDSHEFGLNPSLIDFYIEPNNIETSGISILEEIFLFEPSYIRYDNDPTFENGDLHPLIHLDVNYSSYGTFKLGLRSLINEEYFEDLQNTKTGCSFLERQ